VAVLPAEIPTGLVTGQFYFVNEDNIDADTDPNLTVVTGRVRFICEAKEPLRMPTKKAVVIPLTFDAEFDSQGRLVPLGQTDVGIEIPASNSALFNPTNFTWKVEFDLVDASTGYTVVIPSFSIIVPEGVTSDLVDLMPVSTAPGTIMVQGPQGAASTVPGPQGVGIPAGGSALQVVRKNAGNTTTEWATPDKTMVGLSNVDNTTDALKPVSAPQQTALDLKPDLTDVNNSTLRFDQFPVPLPDVTAINAGVTSSSIVRVAGGMVYAAFWGSDMNPYIAQMNDGDSTWQVVNLGALPGNPLNAPAPADEHNGISIVVDGDGFIHVSGNHHRVPLNYVRSAVANSITDGWVTPGMVGTNELEVTYPQFIKLNDGNLLFFYRDGTSSDGDLMLNKYDKTTKTWTRVGMILKGHDWLTAADDMSAYPGKYTYDTVTGRLHLWWEWRDTTSIDSNVDFCYMFSTDNGTTWSNAAGTAQTLPITPATAGVKIFTGGSGHVVSGTTVDGSGNSYAALRMADGENRLYKRVGASFTYTVMGTGMGHCALAYTPDGNVYAIYSDTSVPYIKRVAPTVGTAIRLFPWTVPNWTPGLAEILNGSYTIRVMVTPVRKKTGSNYGGILTFDATANNLANLAAGKLVLPKPRAIPPLVDPVRHAVGSYGMVPDMVYGPAGPRALSTANAAGTFRGSLITAARAGKIVEATINVTTAGGTGAKVRIVAYRTDGKVVAQSADIDVTTTGQKTIAFVCNIGKNEQYVLGTLHHSGTGAILTAISGHHDSRIPMGSPTNYFTGVKSGWALTSVPVPAVDTTSFLDPATGLSQPSNDNTPLVAIKCGARPGDWLSGSE